MPLSAVAQKALEDSAKINAVNIKLKQTQQAKQEADRKQAEKEYNDFQLGQAELKRQIAEVEQAEIEQARLIVIEETRKQKVIDDQRAFELRHTEPIAKLQADRLTAMQNVNRYENYFIWARDGSKSWYESDGTRRSRLIGSSQLQVNINIIARNYNTKIDHAQFIYAQERNKRNLQLDTTIGASFKAQALRHFSKYPTSSQSLSKLARTYEANFKAKQEQQARHAFAISASQLKADHAKTKNTVAEFALLKEEEDKKQARAMNFLFTSTPTKAGDLKKKATKPARQLFQPIPVEIKTNLKALKSYQATQQAKSNLLKEVMDKRNKLPKIEAPTPRVSTKSNAFLTKAPPTAKDLLKDNRALPTFKETQRQQKELSRLVAGASNAKEATAIKERFQKLNPYVGTPQTANTKQGKAEQGVLIDLKIPELFPKAYADEGKPIGILNQQTTTKTSYEITIGDRTITLDSKESADRLIKRLNNKETAIPEYQFIDQDGTKVKPNTKESFKFMSMMAGITPGISIPSSRNDNYFNDNLDKFDFTPNRGNDPKYSGGQDSFLDIAMRDPINRGILSHLVDPGNTPEGKGIHDILNVGGAFFSKEKPMPQKSEFIDYVNKKLETDEGKKELLGSAIGSYFALRIFTEVPAYASGKISQYVINPITSKKTIKIAEGIAEGIRLEGRDPGTEKLISKFPGMPESMKAKIRTQNNKETVGIEMLDSRTALIKRGTETTEVNTPFIIVKTGKNPHSKLYEMYTADRPGAYSNILISGKQGKELTGGIKQSKDINQYPATRDNILKTANSDKLAPVGTFEKVGLEGMKERPLAVIEKIETQEMKTGGIILETQRLNKIKSMNQDVKGLNKVDDIIPGNKKPFKPDTGKPGTKISLEIPGNKNTATLIPGITNKTKRETLEKIIKNTNKEPVNIKLDGLTKLSSISVLSPTQAIRSIQGTGATQRSEGATQQRTQTQTKIKTDLDQGLKSASQTKTAELTGLKLKLDTMIKNKPFLDPKYSLITKPGLQEKQGTIPILGTDIDQEQITTPIYSFKLIEKQITPPIIPTRTPIRPIIPRPGFPISLDLDFKKEVKTKNRTGKPRITFYRYNVNTESVGRYIEQAPDISTGRTRKTITRIDQLEKRINNPYYQKKQTRKDQKRYDKELTVSKKSNKGSLSSRGWIPNISEPKGKKAKKALKNLGFKLNIF